MFKRLKELRKKNNLTQKDISKKLEISQSLYCFYENNKKQVPITILSKLAKEYNTSIDYIVGDTDEIKPHIKSSFKS